MPGGPDAEITTIDQMLEDWAEGTP